MIHMPIGVYSIRVANTEYRFVNEHTIQLKLYANLCTTNTKVVLTIAAHARTMRRALSM